MSADTLSVKRRKMEDVDDDDVGGDEEEAVSHPNSQSGPLEPFVEEGDDEEEEGAEPREPSKKEIREEDEVDVTGNDEDEIAISSQPSSDDHLEPDDESMRTPTKKRVTHYFSTLDEHTEDPEHINSSFPCQVIPETLGRMTRTPPDGEDLLVFRNRNGRLRIYVADIKGRYSCYSTLTHKPCAVCNRMMKYGEMHLNFPADLDRRRIWANLLGFKYKDILRSKLGPVSLSISSGPICTEHFAEECFRNHNFNKAAIEAFGVPVAISPDVKTTPSKKRVPWVCTMCDFHSCSVVELQTHLLDHTEEMMKQKDNAVEVPEAGFMCPFCRKCTYGYKTISGYRRHLASGPIHHCHLRRIYEFAKMNCRATELDPMDSWDNWTRRNVYVAYHGCEPPANEIVLTPSPTKKAYAQNPEERTKMVHDAEKRKKAVRSLSFVGKEGGTSVNDHNVMQRQVYLQIRREMVHAKKAGVPDEESETAAVGHGDTREEIEERREPEQLEQETESDEMVPSPKAPEQKNKPSTSKKSSSESAKPKTSEKTSSSSSASKKATPASPTPAKKRKAAPAAEEPKAPPPAPRVAEVPEEDEETRRRREQIDERFAEMIAKRAQQVKRLINAKKFKQAEKSPQKPRMALQDTLRKGITFRESPEPSTVKPSTPRREPTPEDPDAPSTSSKKTSSTPSASTPAPTRVTRSQKSGATTPATAPKAAAPATRSSGRKAPEASAATSSKTSESESSKTSAPEKPKKPSATAAAAAPSAASPEERPLKSMLARSLTAGVRPSMAQYRLPMETSSSSSASSGDQASSRITTGAGTSKSISTGAIQNRAGSASPGGLFSQRVMGAVQQEKGGPGAPVGAVGGGGGGVPSKRPAVLARRPLILSPRKRAAVSNTTSSTTSRPISHHESSPILSATSVPMGTPLNKSTSSSSSNNAAVFNLDDEILISAKDLEVEMIEEVVDSVAAGHSTTPDEVLIPAPSGALGAAIGGASAAGASIPITYGTLTLAEVLDQDRDGAGTSSVKDHEFEDISKKMGDGALYCRAMEDVIKSRTVTKMRADMRLSRHCIRQIEAARARARLFGEGTEDYQIYYSTDGAQVLSKNDPKWREIQQTSSNQPGPSDQA